jgi:hypothetical protein
MMAAERQSAFIQGCYDHAEKLRLGSAKPKLDPIAPYFGLLGYGFDLSDEARRDIADMKGGVGAKSPNPIFAK